MRPWFVLALVCACGAAPANRAGTDVPAAPGKADGAFAVTGAKGWYLAGNALTPGDDRLSIAIRGDASVVDVWLDQRFAGEARATSSGFAFDLDLDGVAIGEHQLLLAADGANIAFAEVRFHKSHPLYVAVSNDWDDPDNGDPMLERQERLHARHPELVITHFVGPYTFTDPSVSATRRQFLVDWVTGMARDHGDEIGLHVHPWCNFVRSAGVTCRTSPSFAKATDTTGYTVILASYTKPELEKLFRHATTLFQANGLPRPTSFRAGGWTASVDVLEALSVAGHVTDSSGCNWARIEEWENHPGADLFPWNREHWSSIDDTSQPYYPSADDLQADAAPHLPILEVPDNGALVDYVSAAEMIAMFRANFPGGDALAEPRVYAIGYHPPNFSEAFFQRMDGALTEIDRHLAAAGTGPVVYARMSELTKAFPRP
ncbi:MAG: hypothetical protein H0V17_10555 [Deltaproteobacteria bacterium]|nr:hypothetical protein [Deltaproteobacteria bacterium]